MEHATVSKVPVAAKPSLPPGPKTPGLVLALRYRRDPLAFVPGLRRRYGDVVMGKLPFLGKVVFLTSPELVKGVFTTPAQFHTGEVVAKVLEPSLGPNSVLTLDDAPHMQQRKLLLPPFHGESVKRYDELIREIALGDMASWPVGKPFAIAPHTLRISLAVILKAVFGVHDAERLDRAEHLLETFNRWGNVAIIPGLGRNLGRFSPWGRFVRARSELNEFLYEEIAARRAEADGSEPSDVLSLLLQARHDDGSPMSEEELRDELFTIIGTGHETAAIALAWAVERLLRTPRVLQRLRESIAAGEDDYVDATVKETLRARPILGDLVRKLTAPAEIGGYKLKAGTFVLPSVTALHYREDLYPKPEEFRPERFLDGKTSTYAWIPFGGGIRRCIGAAFAEREMRIVLKTIFERADLVAPDPKPERVKFANVLFSPAKGTVVTLTRPLS